MKKTLLILPLIILFVTNCGIQKRKYQKGYYVNWNKSKTQKDKKEVLAKNKDVEKPEVIIVTESYDVELVASVNNYTHLLPAEIKRPKQPQIKVKDEPCDELIFKDGTELKGKIIEITPIEVKYKKCDMLDGPNYVARKSDIFMIKYANGTREVFNTEKEAKNVNQKSSSIGSNSKSNDSAILALVLGILGIVAGVGSIPAIIVGNNALKKIKEQPDKYEGEDAATVGKILGIVGLVIKLLIFMLIILIIAASI